MTLVLHQHPLASFCWKALIALYENGTPFEAVLVDFGDAASREAFAALWPLAKMPVLEDRLEDGSRRATVAEASVVIEYLDTFHPGAVRFLPADPDAAWRVRMLDRVFDNYVHQPMQRIVADELRPPDARDPSGVAEARAQLQAAYAFLDGELKGRKWAAGDAFGLADCAAMPVLFYGDVVEPIGSAFPALTDYRERLLARPSARRVVEEARPWFRFFPLRHLLPAQWAPGD